MHFSIFDIARRLPGIVAIQERAAPDGALRWEEDCMSFRTPACYVWSLP